MPAAPGALLQGATYHLRALELLGTEKRLWRYIWQPMLVTLVVGGLFYAGALWAGWQAIEWLAARIPEWLGPLEIVMHVGLVVGILLLTGVLLARFGVILGAPWYGALAEEIERMTLPAEQIPPPRPGPFGFVQDIGAAIGYELRKLTVAIAIGVPLLLLNLVPVAGSLVSTAGGFALWSTIVCMDFLEPAQGRRRFRFRRKLRTVFRHMPATGGFGAVSLILVSIPVVNLLTVPLSVTAGTLLFCDHIAPTLAEANGEPLER